jgi:4-amino-4-deoxy-L-arabinose transferase-like glycosyltransferase
MVEFPLINGLVATIIRALPQLDLIVTSRFVSILFSLGAIASLHWLVKQIADDKVALASAAFMAFLPFSIYYSRVILPEPAMMFFATVSLALFTAYLKQKQPLYWWLSWLALAVALVLKPFVAFFAPVYLALIIIYQQQPLKQIKLYLYPILAVIPFVYWRNWIQQFSAGIPASNWLFNGNGIRLRPAWFRWLFWERLTKLMAGVVGVIFGFANFIKRNRVLAILLSWWLGIMTYFAVIATGNVTHDYYQALVVPCLSFTLGRGVLVSYNWLKTKLTNKIILAPYLSALVIAILSVTALIISWQRVKGYFNVNHWEYYEVGQIVQQILPKEALVIAPAGGDTMFLFQTRRRGWPIGHNIKDKIDSGATHYVTTSYDQEAKELEQQYTTVKKTSDYLILDLTREK